MHTNRNHQGIKTLLAVSLTLLAFNAHSENWPWTTFSETMPWFNYSSEPYSKNYSPYSVDYNYGYPSQEYSTFNMQIPGYNNYNRSNYGNMQNDRYLNNGYTYSLPEYIPPVIDGITHYPSLQASRYYQKNSTPSGMYQNSQYQVTPEPENKVPVPPYAQDDLWTEVKHEPYAAIPEEDAGEYFWGPDEEKSNYRNNVKQEVITQPKVQSRQTSYDSYASFSDPWASLPEKTVKTPSLDENWVEAGGNVFSEENQATQRDIQAHMPDSIQDKVYTSESFKSGSSFGSLYNSNAKNQQLFMPESSRMPETW